MHAGHNASAISVDESRSDEDWFKSYKTHGSDKVYSQWAETYDTDTLDSGPTAKEELVKNVMTHVENHDSAVLLDVAAGTGIIGEMLRKSGFKGIMDGIEANTAMMKKAEEKGIYRNYIISEVNATCDLPVAKMSYDVVTVAGAFFPHHLEPRSLVPVMRCLKSGGLIVFYAHTDGEYGVQLEDTINGLQIESEMRVFDKRNVIHFTKRKVKSGDAARVALYTLIKC